ncbi:hypothetical protein [Vulcaniibacterium tengchongense]|uniref:hypothetical protein n=1 Tax=Vulcaniibacterium tengchongense TaxID=1273429 RepID=UPI000F4E0CDC|nr:hypothetical protein [Vulcaniibacterium tengchongense]
MKRIIALVPLLCALAWVSGCDSSSGADAVLACQEAIRMAAKNPSSAEIPYVAPRCYPAEELCSVRWDHGDGLRLQNGFGAMIDTTAICIVKRGAVTGLDLDGKSIL